MRVRPPTLSLTAAEARLETELVPDDAAEAPFVVQLGVPRHLLGWVDTTANPFVPIAAAASVWTGEDVAVDGVASEQLLVGAAEAAAVMAGWFGRRPPTVVGHGRAQEPAPPGPGRGLYFTRGVDSWATWLRPGGEGSQATHLLVVDGIDRTHSETTKAEVWADHQRAADALGLPLIRFTTNARDLLDPLAAWDWTHGAVLAALGLALGPLLGRVAIASSFRVQDDVRWGSHAELDPRWSTESTTFVHVDDDLGRWPKTELVAGHDLALGSLKVCWRGDTAANCGRCAKCLRTMTTLWALGALDRCDRFEHALTPEAVRALEDADLRPFVDELLRHLPLGSGELRRAWEDTLGGDGPRLGCRVVGPASVAVAGPDLLDRLDPALAAVGLRPVAPDESDGARDAHDGEPTTLDLAVGWEPGMVPLRPALADLDAVADRLRSNPERDLLWVVAEPYPPGRPHDAGRLLAADAANRAWGPGVAYLPGIPWSDDEGPVLDRSVVAGVLDRCRVRLWWGDDGTLDPIRVVESIERGCLPLQLMPDAAAASLRRRLPPALAALVVDADGLAAIVATEVTPRLAAAADAVLAGSLERDVASVGPPDAHG